MRRGLPITLALLLAAGTYAAEPAAPRDQTTLPGAGKPLDLRLGDIRRYITPEEYRSLLGAPAQEANTVIVQADGPLLPMKSEQPVPGGLASLWYAATHPTQLWRIFVPDLQRAPMGPPESKIPPREFRWGP